jgi:hypothetical protein
VEDEDNRSMLLPIVALGSEDGWELLEAPIGMPPNKPRWMISNLR